jgi:hypothetical protein
LNHYVTHLHAPRWLSLGRLHCMVLTAVLAVLRCTPQRGTARRHARRVPRCGGDSTLFLRAGRARTCVVYSHATIRTQTSPPTFTDAHGSPRVLACACVRGGRLHIERLPAAWGRAGEQYARTKRSRWASRLRRFRRQHAACAAARPSRSSPVVHALTDDPPFVAHRSRLVRSHYAHAAAETSCRDLACDRSDCKPTRSVARRTRPAGPDHRARIRHPQALNGGARWPAPEETTDEWHSRSRAMTSPTVAEDDAHRRERLVREC